MIRTHRAYLVALRNGVLGGAAAVIGIYALAMLVATTGMLTGVLGDTYGHSLMGVTISRHETGEAVEGSVSLSGLTVTGIAVVGVLVALLRCRRHERARSQRAELNA